MNATINPRIGGLRHLTARFGLAAWAVLVTVISGSLLASHLLTLPAPAIEDAALTAGVAGSRGDTTSWTLLHALSTECGCSERVINHLLASDRPAGVEETLLIVGPPGDLAERAAAHGLRFVNLTAEELAAKYSIQAVPLLVIADPSGAVRYSGGYTTRKRGPNIQDVEILASLRGGDGVAPLPLFGCPVSLALRDSLNPIGLR